MKIIFYKPILQLFIFLVLCTTSLNAQFTRLYGANTNESFTKVIQSGTNYYCLGRWLDPSNNQSKATITKMNSTGQHIGTLALNIASEFTDALLTPSGDLMVVGYTAPLNSSSQSIMGKYTTGGTGSFSFVRSYDVPGRDFFNRIARSPQGGNFPYYILGAQNDPSNPSATWDDVVLLNVNDIGTINWKRKFTSNDDDEFFHDLEILANGEMVIAGVSGNRGILARLDANGIALNAGTPENLIFSYTDISRLGNTGYYAVGETSPNFIPYIIRYDNDFIPQWHFSITGLTDINQVWNDPATGRIFVTGTGLFNGKSRAVLLRLFEVARGSVTIEWVRFLDNAETSYTGGSYWFLSPNQIGFTDGRVPAAGGFGGNCAFLHVNNMELLSCMTKNVNLSLQTRSHIYNSPEMLSTIFDIPRGVNILSSALNWNSQDACQLPCTAAFSFQNITSCGNIQFTNQSTGAAPISYNWTFGDPSSGNNNSSTSSSPTHQFRLCGTYMVCLKITTSDQCMDTICQSVTFIDNIKPVITCPMNITVSCNGNTNPVATGTATATDNCMNTAPILIAHSDVTTGNIPCDGIIGRTWIATDACGNASSCLQLINIKDNVPPVIVCPPGLTLQCNTIISPATTGTASATDDCTPTASIIISFTDQQTGNMPCNGIIRRTWSATDACKNTSNCVQVIRINDTTRPTIYCPTDRVLQCNVSNPSPTGSATATDNCTSTSNIKLSSLDVLTGQAPCNLTITRTWTAEDDCKNKASCVQILKMVDTIPPTISCPRNPTVSTDPGLCYFTGTYPSAVASDSCDSNPTLVCSLITPTSSILITPTIQYPKGVNTITCYAVDLCGNKSQNCTFTLTVEDKEAPKILCPLSITVLGNWDSLGRCKAVVNNIAPTVSDNCPMYNYGYQLTGATVDNGRDEASGIQFMSGVTTVTYVVVDMGLNKDSCRFTIKVLCEPTPCDIDTLNNGLVGYFPFLNNANDLSLTSINGIVAGPSLTLGHDNVNNSAYHFNGFGQYINCGSNNRNITKQVSIMAWIKTSKRNAGQWIAGKYEFTENKGYGIGIGDNLGNNLGKVAIAGRDGLGQTYYSSGYSYDTVNDGRWHCIVGTVGNGIWSIYIDGNLQNSAPGGSFDLTTSASVPFTIGAFTGTNSGTPLRMEGDIDNVIVYNRVLSQKEIDCLCPGNLPLGNSCICGSFSNLSVRLHQGAPNQTVNCGDTIPLNCPFVFQFGGEFQCQGQACERDAMDWKLDGPGGIDSSGTLFAASFGLPLDANNFSLPGLYTLTLVGYCNGLPCPPCKIYFEVKACDSCVCGSFSNLSARLTGGAQNQAMQCGKTYALNCPSVFQFGGEFLCQGNDCDSSKVDWNINGPINDSGTVGANTGFTLPLTAQSFSVNGLYTLTLTGYCNGKPCSPCVIYFEVTGCSPCCKDSVSFSNVVANFQSNGALGDCTIFQNGTGLDSCMQVTWTWGDGATTGPVSNAVQVSHVYNVTGTYNVCYLIEELDANGKVCHSFKKCESIYIICTTCCDELNNIIANGDFISQLPGNLTSNSLPWFAANLSPQIGTGDSCATPRTAQMWGNSAVGEVMGQTIPGQFKNGWKYRISFCAKFININNLPPNLQHGWFNLEAENGTYTGNGATIGQSPILNQHDVWNNVCLPDWTPTANYSSLFINFQNSSTTNHGDSVSWGRIDDICIQVIDSGCCENASQFANLVNQGFTIVQSNCKVTVTAPQFDSCYLFSTEPVLDGGIVPQVITNTNGMWMYNFTQSGIHQVCVTVFDDCNVKQMCTRFEVKCDTCECGTFSSLSARTSIGLANRIINCNDTIPLDCPQVFQFGGEFNCKGNDCDSITKIDWTLNGPINTSGSMNISTGFTLPLTVSAFAASGLYTLTLTGYCDGKPCPSCKIYFNVTACDSSWSCPCDNSTSNIELVQNGHFSLGNDGSFSNDYNYFNAGTNTAIGGYSVVTNIQVPQANSQWACNDHTTGTGQFLIVDGASNTGGIAWEQIIPGSDSGSFNLCFYVNNLVIPSKDYDDPIIGVFINGTQIIPNTTLPENPDVWVPFNVTWVGNLPAKIEIHTLSGNVVGNDFAIDDISFTKCSKTDCIEDFEDETLGSAGQWQVVNGTVSVVNTIPKIPPSQVLCGLDDDGGSWMFNIENKFTGNWIQKFGGNCFCFDIRYDNGSTANPATGTSTLNIYSGSSLTDPSGFRATFVVNNGIGNAWERICVPIGLSSGGILPGNQFGQWTSTSSAVAFDYLIQNVVGIAFVLDFASGNSPSEKLYVDNFCIEKCPPDNCICGSFSNLTIRTGGAPNQPIQCGKTYTLSCPSAFQFGGDFVCQGDSCDSTKVDWKITGPISNSGTVGANTGFTLPLNAQSFSINGLYTLTLTGYCNGKPCPPCSIYFEVTGCNPCCKDSTAFANAVANFQTNGALGNCTIFANGTGLDSCMQVTWSWGDNSTTGPVGNGVNVSHTYTGTGTYNVCYKILELDANGNICNRYLKCDSIYVICDTCECAGADHLSFGGHDFSIDASCNSDKIIDLPCDANGQPFYFHGNVLCAGDSCMEGKFDWIVKDTTGGITTSGFGPIHIMNASTGHFDINNLNAALFTPGVVYTLTVTWYCGGKKCTCDIKFRFKDCDCKCGKFTNVFLRPNHGAPSIPVKCDGDAQIVACPSPGQPFNISGQFNCEGDECPTNTQIDWMLLDPSGNKVDSGIFSSTPGWSLNLNNHHFGKAGTYTLMLTGHCGSQLCSCKIKFTFKEACPCDDCTCGKYSDMFVRAGQAASKPVSCGDTALINCPGNGLNVILTGKMLCVGDSCPKTTTLDWILINPLGNSIASGNGVIVNPDFTLSVSSSLLTSSGVYTLQLIGNCGMQRCTCEVKIKMEKPCPDKCECDGYTILTAISRGPIVSKNCGDSIYVPTDLKLFFSAQINCKGICPPASSITMILIDPNGKLVPVTNIDENSFPIPGTYTLELTGYCGNKVCKCKIYFIKSTDCCKDEQIFEQDVLNNVTLSTDPVTCKVTLNTGKLSECSCISKISWGDGNQTFGPIMTGGMSMHTYAATGTYIVSYIVSETDPATGEYCNVNVFKDTVKVQCGPKLGLQAIYRNEVDSKIRVFPNPNTGAFIVDLITPAIAGTKLRVVDLTGKLLAEKVAEQNKSAQSMNVQSLPSGLYFIQIQAGGKLIAVEKFIKH